MKVLHVLEVMLSDNAIVMSMIVMKLIQLQSLYCYYYVLMYVYVEVLLPLSLRLILSQFFFQGARISLLTGSVSVYTVKQPTCQPSDLRTSFCIVGLFWEEST